MKLNIRRRASKRIPTKVKQALFQLKISTRYVHWILCRILSELEESSGYWTSLMILTGTLIIETDASIPVLRAIWVLEQLRESRGLPQMIRLDNGSEFIISKLD